MDRLRMESRDAVEGNVAKIARLFPHCVTEIAEKITDLDGTVKYKSRYAIDFDKLQAELSKDLINSGEERYQFTWPDKRAASRLANTPTNKTLRPDVDASVDFWNTQNLYIEGDNLDVLKVLRENYLGKVKMIYIDPPYNTGNDFVYNDDFAQNKDDFESTSGLFDEDGNQVLDPMQRNTESNGRFHTDWLNMIYPRLKVARDLLTENGVMFLSIDENEVENLKRLCDEIFGSKNFISQLIWSAGRKNDSKYISVSHEYILCYFRNADYIKENKIVWREKKQGLEDIYAEYERLKKAHGGDFVAIEKGLKGWYKALPNGHPAKDHSHYNKVDAKGIFFADNISWPGGGGPKYEVLHPVTHKPVTVPSRGWITSKDNLQRWIDDDRVLFGETEAGVPTIKAYLIEREYAVPYSVLYKDGRAASKRLAVLMGDKVFENPKDEEIIQRIIEFCGVSDGDIVMDFFSGSGTTAHSVFLASLNKNICIKFILVQLCELIFEENATAEKGKKVARAAITLCDKLGVPRNICEIAKERIRRAGKKIKEELDEKIKEKLVKIEVTSKQVEELKEKENKKKKTMLFAEEEETEIKKLEEKIHTIQEEINELTARKDGLDIGFRVLKLDSSNMEDVFYTPEDFSEAHLFNTVDNVKPDRTPLDLLFQVMPELDIELSAKIEEKEVNGKKVFFVDGTYLIATFDKDVNESTVTEIAKMHPQYFVMRDSSAANDNVLDNFEQIFKHYSPDTIRRIL